MVRYRGGSNTSLKSENMVPRGMDCKCLGLGFFRSRTHVIAEGNARVVGAADASAFHRSPADVAGAWKAVEIVDTLSNASSVAVVEDTAVGRYNL